MVVREVMLFGKEPEVAAKSPMIEILGHGFMQSIDMVAAELGWTLDPEKISKHEYAVATVDMDTPVGVIEKGTVAAQRFTWQGTVGGMPVMTVRVNWLMGSENLDPPWTLGEQRFEVEFDAEPPVKTIFHGLHPPVIGEHAEIGLIPPARTLRQRDPVRGRSRPRDQDLPRSPPPRRPRHHQITPNRRELGAIYAPNSRRFEGWELEAVEGDGEGGGFDAAVDFEDLAGHERRRVRRQVDHRGRDVGG